MTTIYRFACYPRSSQWDSLNLDIDERNILFHVSLRPDRKRIVVNELTDGAWGTERELPFDFTGACHIPFTVIDAGARLHLLAGGELRASAEARLPRAMAVAIRASMRWTSSAPFGPFLPEARDVAWLPPEGIGTEALRGLIAAPGWAGGAVEIGIGAMRLAAQAIPVPTAPDLPQGFVVPLDAEAREALSRAERDHRQATPVTLAFAGGATAAALVNAPGLVESLSRGRIAGWLRARGAPPRLTLTVDGKAVPAPGTIGGDPDFPGDSLIATWREPDEDYAPERRIAFSMDLPADLPPGGLLRLLADDTALEGGLLAIAVAPPEAMAATDAVAAGAPPADPPDDATGEAPGGSSSISSGAGGDTVEVLRLDLPPGASRDIWLDLVAPNGDIPLHLRYRAAENWLVTNHCTGGAWGSETVLGRLPSSWFRIVVDLELSAGRCAIAVNHESWGEVRGPALGIEALEVKGSHHRFIRSGARPGATPPSRLPIGAVDHVGRGRLHGWAVGAPADAPLLVDLGEGPVALHPEWQPMPAFAARLKREGDRIGFEATLPAGLEEKLAGAWRRARVTLGEELLTVAPPWTSAVVEIDGFTLRGEVIGDATPRIGLLVAGSPFDLPVIQWEEPPVPPLRGDGPGQPRHGFEIELPGTIWCGLPPDAGATLAVTVDGRVIEPGELLLTRAMARQALIRAAERGDGTPAAQGQALVAVEHLAFGRFLPDLPPDAAGTLRDFARRMKLDAFIQREAAPRGGEAPPPEATLPTPADRQRITVWRALRSVSQRMEGDEGRVFAHALAVQEEWKLEGEACEHFWFALVPTLCAADELPLLAPVMPLSVWFGHENGADAWALSSAVALLAAAGESKRATDALYRLAGATDGWINTACIGFALRHLEAGAAAGSVPARELERFRYAFMELLDAFKGAWFSRLHDRHFVDGMLLLVGRRHLMPDYLAQDVVRAALRHYGLSASFWHGWSAGAEGEAAEAGGSLLALARQHFATLEAAMALPRRIDRNLPALQAALGFFGTQRNPEASFWLREIAAHVMRPGSIAKEAAVARLLAALAATDPRDAVRFLAMPDGGAGVPGGLPTLGIGPEGLRDLLREMRPQPRGMADRAQRQLCRLIAAPEPGDTARTLAEMLAAARYHHVGADMLCLMAARSRADSAENHALIGRFGTELLRMLEEEATPHLPAPFLAGLARLQRLPDSARPARADVVMRLLRDAVAARFQARHDATLAPVPSPTITFDPTMIAGDVLVCVYSCNKYLDSRVAAIRETWMKDLAAVGARCIVIVGDGDDRLDGDVLRLAVSDAYEDLPQKTLRMVEWVHANTDAQYLIKIDDDCHLSVENYFGTLDYRAHHYYGRLLERAIGGTDRVWHHQKSSSERARSIDRSPEPSRYCDGGGVYSLSRHAMGRLVAASKRREGQVLVARSFMEDKLVGDLLALEEITPVNADYESYQRRRTFGAAHPIGIYENTFFPSAIAPAKVAHLDLDRDQARAHALRGQAVLSPQKIWPSFSSVGTDHNAHQLELLSGAETLARAQAERIGVVLAARNEMTMLPHLLDHYRGLGVRAFYAVDNASDDGSREWLLSQPDVVVYSAASEYRTSHYGVTWQQTVLGHHFLGRWAVVADADELLIYPGWRKRPLASLVTAVEAEGADAVPLWMVDMYPHGGLEEADFATTPPFEAAPWMDREPVHASRLTTCFYSNRVQQVSALRHRLLPDSEPNGFVAEKVAMFRYQPSIRLSEGLHSATNLRLSRQRAVFAHFKYHAGFRRKIMEEIARGQHYNGAIEYKRYAAMLAEGSGGFGREGLSVRLGADGFLSDSAEHPKKDLS